MENKLSFLVYGGLLSWAVNLLIGFFVLVKNPDRKINRSFFCLNICIGSWSLGSFLLNFYPHESIGLLLLKISYVFAFFLFYFFLRFTHDAVEQKIPPRWLWFSIVSVAGLLLSLPGNSFISGVRQLSDGMTIERPGLVYYFFISGFALIGLKGLKLLLVRKGQLRGTALFQINYIFFAYTVALAAGVDYFLSILGIVKTYPYDDYVLFFSFSMLAYAIVKYRLMDIRLAFTRAGIFLTVYTLVLGIPVWVGWGIMGQGLWLFPVTLMAVLATGGPFLYLWIQRRAEASLLAEQRKYQTTLRQASAGMGRIRDLKKLLNLIVFILTRVVRIEHVMIYFIDRDTGDFHLAAARRHRTEEPAIARIESGYPLVKYLSAISLPLVRDDVSLRSRQEKDAGLAAIDQNMGELRAEIAFPVFIRTHMTAIVIMGKKSNGRHYTEDDLNVFSILANQASLAVENALSYEDMKKTQEQLFKAEKMATIGTMADGLSHQINNRLHAMGFVASDMLDTLKLRKAFFATEELRPLAEEFEHSLSRIQDNVTRGGEIVQGLMRYTRQGEEGFAAYSIDAIIRSAYEMAQFKIRSLEFRLLKAFNPETIPRVRGNFTQLQEVFFNLIDNAYDATVQRKADLRETDYAGALTISAHEVNGLLEIVFSDNGIGVKSSDRDKLFTPFFTTKATTKKGTGLGLYVIRKIIEDNHGGKVDMHSVYGQGTEMTISLATSKDTPPVT